MSAMKHAAGETAGALIEANALLRVQLDAVAAEAVRLQSELDQALAALEALEDPMPEEEESGHA